MLTSRLLCLLCVASFPEFSLPSGAQVDSQSLNAARIAAQIRTVPDDSSAVAVLRQRRGARSAQQLDEIGDSLVAIAIASAPADTAMYKTHQAALDGLMHAGSSDGPGAPYRGAADRLLRIAENTADVGIRGSAISALSVQPDIPQAIRMLTRIAASPNPGSFGAILLMCDGKLAPLGGLSALRELYTNELVREPTSLYYLSVCAGHHGWPRR